MKKKMLVWIGAAVLATSMAAACSKKNAGTTPVENTPAAGGDAYGGGAYGAPATPAPEAAPEATPPK